MKALLVHNYYQQPGGEDVVFQAEGELLEAGGCTVERYTVHNDAARDMGRLALARDTIWNQAQYLRIRERVRAFEPDVVHVHNTLPIISPAVYYAAHAGGAAVVQTLHNYRLICPSALLLRNGKPCELCVAKPVALPGVAFACYRGSRAATSVVAAMLAYHRLRRTYRDAVDRYVVLTEFAKRLFARGGLPEDRIRVKPNFLPGDPGVGQGDGGYALFVGRLSEEKGLRVLLDAWRIVGSRVPLRIVGDGPLMEEVASLAQGMESVQVLGWLGPHEVMAQLKGAACLVIPSVWFEGYPMTLIEAFAVGTPVIASRLGALAENVEHERTGLHFSAADAESLAAAIVRFAGEPQLARSMRREARRTFEAKYSAGPNLAALMAIYDEAMASTETRRGARDVLGRSAT